jgi:LmbE family N-acetylglucosaminyl deacetylase
MIPTAGSMLVGATLVALFGSTAHARRQPGGAELKRAIERLATVGNVLYVAAHPDDENTRLLAWLVEDQKLRAAYLSLTRGEGGQNLIGSEQAPLLGVIRTQELLAARGVDGAEQLFGRQRDFGYSKTPEETLAIWGKHESLADVVWAIRRFRPDVIVTRFSPEMRDTHGHHTASAMLALEAFKLAADPKAYPEQLEHVQPWQAKRIVWNRGVFGGASPDELKGFMKIDLGGYDPLLGVSFSEVAARSRTMHKSQGFGASPSRGPAPDYFRVLDGAPMERSLLDGVDTTWARVKGSEKLRELLAKARATLDIEKPWLVIPTLLEARRALEALPDNPWKSDKRAELDEVIAACAGLFVDATAGEPSTIPGGEVKVKLTAVNRTPAPLRLAHVDLVEAGKPTARKIDKSLATNQPETTEATFALSATTPPSNPYWLDEAPEAGRWSVRDQMLVGLPEQAPPLVARFYFEHGADKQLLQIERPVGYAWNDPVSGERRRPLEVLPPVSLDPRAPLLVFPDGNAKDLRVVVRASRGAVAGVVKPEPPAGFTVEPPTLPFKLPEANASEELVFRVRPPAHVDGESLGGALKLTATLDGDGSTVSRGVQRIEYPHIPIQTLTPPAQVKLMRFDLKRAVTRVGYIPGAGDEVPSALRQAGYEVTLLSPDALLREPLDHFQAIVVGVRAFNVEPRLAQAHQRLMDYVQRGGTLLVQYNTQNRISKIGSPIGPWPLDISQDRVTDENAAVERLDPKHPVFHSPNPIGEADFAGWVQERGLYFADKWDPKYQPLISMHDPGESPKKGGLLWAKYGKGIFVYTGLAFFRQLPAGVPGAFRLFANLLSHGR